MHECVVASNRKQCTICSKLFCCGVNKCFSFCLCKASEVMGKPQFRISKQAQTVYNPQVLTCSSFCLVSVLLRRFCGDIGTLFILVFVCCFREIFHWGRGWKFFLIKFMNLMEKVRSSFSQSFHPRPKLIYGQHVVHEWKISFWFTPFHNIYFLLSFSNSPNRKKCRLKNRENNNT
jgi:hypothetical protein